MRYRAVNVQTKQTPPPAHPFQIYNLKEQSSGPANPPAPSSKTNARHLPDHAPAGRAQHISISKSGVTNNAKPSARRVFVALI
jgi:hypothetical protein